MRFVAHVLALTVLSLSSVGCRAVVELFESDPPATMKPDAASGLDARVSKLDARTGSADANRSCPAEPVPPGNATNCPSECTGGCLGSVCMIDCIGDGSCDTTDIVCPADFDCLIRCHGIDACDSGSITCPADYGCWIECAGGNDACGSQDVTCGAGACTIDCEPDTCNGANVSCGAGPCASVCDGVAPADIPSIDCTDACSCSACS